MIKRTSTQQICTKDKPEFQSNTLSDTNSLENIDMQNLMPENAEQMLFNSMRLRTRAHTFRHTPTDILEFDVGQINKK